MARMNYPRQKQRRTMQLARQQALDESAYIRDLQSDAARRTRAESALWRDDKSVAFRLKCACGHVGQILTTAWRFKRGLRLRCSQCGKRHRL